MAAFNGHLNKRQLIYLMTIRNLKRGYLTCKLTTL